MRSILLLAVLSAACVNSRDAATGKTRLSADSTSKSVIGATVANAQPAPAPATGGIPAEVMKLGHVVLEVAEFQASSAVPRIEQVYQKLTGGVAVVTGVRDR